MHHVEAVTVCGQPAFHNTHPAISIISGNWVHAQATTTATRLPPRRRVYPRAQHRHMGAILSLTPRTSACKR